MGVVLLFYYLGKVAMTEQEAKDLLLENLQRAGNQNEALCITQRMVYEKILQELISKDVNQETMMNLSMLADAKSRLGYYSYARGDDDTDRPKIFYDGFINIITLWEEAMIFVAKNYSTQDFKKNTGRSLEEIEEIAKNISRIRNRLENEIQNTGRFVFEGWEMSLFNCLIDWATRLILGYNLFDKFAKEYRRLITCLNKCLNQINAGSPSEYKN